jgi:hypothetical protein
MQKIQKQVELIMVERRHSNPFEFMEIDDVSSFTPTIKTILDLFNNHNAVQYLQYPDDRP